MQTAAFLSKRSDKPWATMWRPQPMALDDPRVAFLRRKLRTAGYNKGGIDGRRLFMYYDRDNTGRIGFAEFVSACRRDGKLSASAMSDQELADLFATLDADDSGELQLEEFEAFVLSPDSVPLSAPDIAFGAPVSAPDPGSAPDARSEPSPLFMRRMLTAARLSWRHDACVCLQKREVRIYNCLPYTKKEIHSLVIVLINR
jgi:hypothetical protein